MSGTSPHFISMMLSLASGAAIRMSAPSAVCDRRRSSCRGSRRCWRRYQRPVVAHTLGEVRRPVLVAGQQHARATFAAHETCHVQTRAEALALTERPRGPMYQLPAALQRPPSLRTSPGRAHCACRRAPSLPLPRRCRRSAPGLILRSRVAIYRGRTEPFVRQGPSSARPTPGPALGGGAVARLGEREQAVGEQADGDQPEDHLSPALTGEFGQ